MNKTIILEQLLEGPLYLHSDWYPRKKIIGKTGNTNELIEIIRQGSIIAGESLEYRLLKLSRGHIPSISSVIHSTFSPGIISKIPYIHVKIEDTSPESKEFPFHFYVYLGEKGDLRYYTPIRGNLVDVFNMRSLGWSMCNINSEFKILKMLIKNYLYPTILNEPEYDELVNDLGKRVYLQTYLLKIEDNDEWITEEFKNVLRCK